MKIPFFKKSNNQTQPKKSKKKSLNAYERSKERREDYAKRLRKRSY